MALWASPQPSLLVPHTRLEALRSGGLCCPRRRRYGMASSDFRSALRPFTVAAAYNRRLYRSMRVGDPHLNRRCRDGSLLFRDGLCARSAPPDAGGFSVLLPKVTTPSMAFAHFREARLPLTPAFAGSMLTTRQDSSSYGPMVRSPPEGTLS